MASIYMQRVSWVLGRLFEIVNYFPSNLLSANSLPILLEENFFFNPGTGGAGIMHCGSKIYLKRSCWELLIQLPLCKAVATITKLLKTRQFHITNYLNLIIQFYQ